MAWGGRPVPETFLDKLIDCLLKEELGGQAPPDLLHATLARAYPRRSRAWAWAAGAVAAAAAVVIALVAFSGGKGGPAPGGGAGAVLLNGQAVDRGTVVATEAFPAMLKLGSYVTVEVAPASSLTVEGDSNREAVSLKWGTVFCLVDSNVGTFAVRTPVGTAQAAGTKFTVRLEEEKAPSGSLRKRMVVQVQSGLVLAGGAWGQVALSAGEEAALPPKDGNSGALAGVVAAKGDSWVEVKADGAQKAERHTARWVGGLPKDGGGPDKGVVAAIAKVKVGDRVELKWTQGERKRVVELKSLAAVSGPPGETEGGTVTGVVSAKGDNWVEVKAAGAEKTERYSARYVGGGRDKEVLAQIAKVKIGDKVELKWSLVEQRKRLLSIQVVAPAK